MFEIMSMNRKRNNEALVELMQALGALSFLRWVQRNRVGVLVFHGVVDPDSDLLWQPLRSQLAVQDFRRYLDLLRTRYEFVSLEEAVQILKGESTLRRNCLAVTFD